MCDLGLEQYYKGDTAWNDYAKAVKDEVGICPLRHDIEKFIPDSDIANVICFLVGSNSLAWINQSIPALGGMTPLECMKSQKGVQRLKTMLMRMP